MDIISKSIKSIHKNKITVIAITAFAVALCCIFAFVGNSSGPVEVISDVASEENVSTALLSGEAIYIDGEFVAALNNKTDAEEAIKTVLDARVSALSLNANAENSFLNKIDIVSGEYSADMFVDKTKAVSLLSGETVYDYTDKTLAVKLSVSSVINVSENVVLEHNTKTVYTDSMRNGAKKVVTKGYDGEGKEIYRVVSVDGIETERTFVTLEVTTEPVDEVIRVGARSNGSNVASLNKFIKPYDGNVTSYVGPRWGRTHNGLDISKQGCHGDPVVAAYGGTVVRADVYNGYGNCVIIDHGDGVETLYAHLSAFSVKVGDVVSTGAEIGKIGSTGVSTGPHLHFEVHVDGEIVNPLIFVDYD